MRILYIITKSEVGGAQTHVLDLLRHFAREHELTVAAGEHGFLLDEAERLGVKTRVLRHLVHPVAPLSDLRAVVEIAGLVRALRPDLVHLHSSKAGTVGRLSAYLTGTAAVFTAHGWPFSDGVAQHRKMMSVPIEWLMGCLPAHIIDVSAWDLRLARRFGVGRPTMHHVVHNGVRWLPAGAPRSDGGFVVTMVARFDRQKAQALLIRALVHLPAEVTLKLVGDGPLRADCERLTRELGLTERVRFVGRSSRVAEELERSDVFALISHYEGFPISILEAMRAGLPVVANRVGGVPEAVIEGEVGLLVDHDEREIARAIGALHADAALRRRMGLRARALFEERFTETAMLRAIERVYERALGREGSRVALASQRHTRPDVTRDVRGTPCS